MLDVSSLKIPPHSIEAEQSLLGGLMLVNETWDRVMELVTASDFYRHEHRLIFEAMTALAAGSHPFDVITLSEHLNGIDELDSVGGLAYLGELAANTPSAANVQSYAMIVRERSTMRQLIAAANEIADAQLQPRRAQRRGTARGSREAYLGDQRDPRGARRPAGRERPAARCDATASTSFTRARAASPGSAPATSTSTTAPPGCSAADLIIVAGRPSMGKTAFAMNLVEHAVLKQDKPVLVFSHGNARRTAGRAHAVLDRRASTSSACATASCWRRTGRASPRP